MQDPLAIRSRTFVVVRPRATERHLLEREREIAALAGVLDAAPFAGSVTVIEGEPGVGKTSLLEVVATQARQREFTLLRARGGELERRFGYGVARQLFEPVVAGEVVVDDLWNGPATLASSALGVADRPASAGDSVHGMYWLVRRLAADVPVVVCVDDTQWADDPSLDLLLHLARRCADIRLAIVLAWRTDGGSSEEFHASLVVEPSVTVTTLRPLTRDGAADLVNAIVEHEVSAAFHDACYRVSAGNPFLLAEVLHTLAQEQPVVADDAAAQRIRRLSPPAVTRSVLARLARLPDEARRLATVFAVLDNDATLANAALLGGMDLDVAASAVECLIGACILDGEQDSCRFRHPLLRTVVYEQVAAPVRAAMHLRSAEMLDRGGHSERAVPHLLVSAATGSAWVVDRLMDAATTLPPEAAFPLLERALAEPPDEQTRPSVLVALGEAAGRAGQAGAIETLREAVALARVPDVRDRAVHALVRHLLLAADLDEAAALVHAELARLPRDEHERRLPFEADLAHIALVSPTHSAELGARVEMLAPQLSGRTAAERALLSALVVRRYQRLDVPPPDLVRLAIDALHGALHVEDRRADSLWPSLVLNVLNRLDRQPDAVSFAAAALEDRGVRQSTVATMFAMADRGAAWRLVGTLPLAREDLEQALQLAEFAHHGLALHWIVGHLIHTLAEAGDLIAAEHLLEQHGLGRSPEELVEDLLYGRAALRVAQGRYDDARHDLEALRCTTELRGLLVPAIGVRTLLARCLLALGGDDAEVHHLVDEEFEIATSFGVPSEIAIARRERALRRGGPAATGQLAQAAEELAATPRRLEHALTLLELGSALRRANERAAAREPLRAALEEADRCGATPIAQRALVELRALGERPRRPQRSGNHALTPTEVRVAQLAAQGLTTAQIARTLVVSPKTIESHLTSAYRKLDVHRREDLAASLDGVDQ